MKVLITGACGFVGSTLVRQFRAEWPEVGLVGFDNLGREGAEQNRGPRMPLVHGNLRSASDVAGRPAAGWVIDAAVNPSVIAGLDGGAHSR